jgi:hypothetical protein
MQLITKVLFIRPLILLLFILIDMVTVSRVLCAEKVGDDYGGGIIFYVDDTGQHGLIASKADMSGHSDLERDGFFTWADARYVCENSVENGYNDWFLPDMKQLRQLYNHQEVVPGLSTKCGYWSSNNGTTASMSVNNYGVGQMFGEHNRRFDYYKPFGLRVRAVRAF